MILAINSGSSSIKYKLFDSELELVKSDKFDFRDGHIKNAVDRILSDVGNYRNEIIKVGYRVVHGGDKGEKIMPITLPVMQIIDEYAPLAPHHNPPASAVIRLLIEKLPSSEHFAAFDTAFFADLPDVAKYYPIDKNIANKFGIKKFGFHGISHNWMCDQVDIEKRKNIITIHLGAGSSISAIKNGKPIDTSMGFTTIEGLPMQTRSGDVDPAVILYLVDAIGAKKTRDMIENHSGLAGISGMSGDMLELLDSDSEAAKLAIDILSYRVKKYIGAYAAALNGVEEIIFSGEIGFGSALIRKKITSGLEYLGFETKSVKPDEELAIAKLLQTAI